MLASTTEISWSQGLPLARLFLAFKQRRLKLSECPLALCYSSWVLIKSCWSRSNWCFQEWKKTTLISIVVKIFFNPGIAL
jgi:hypothetical protein